MSEEQYDSTFDTKQHIERVSDLLNLAAFILDDRRALHDRSKLEEPEKSAFDIATPRLKGSTYGSDEYKAFLADLKPALDHHYANNSHHPEHYPNGISGMSLFDIIEMLCDWKAAGERHADGSMERSLRVNKERFGISDQLQQILVNTAKEMGLL